MSKYWAKDEAFDLLIKAITENYCVFFTGAGISYSLTTHADPSKTLPTWPKLIDSLKDHFDASLTLEEKADISTILADKNSTGSQLIEAASIIERRVNKAQFKQVIVNLTKPGKGQTTLAHKKINSLTPRGIVTFNYDVGHENSFAGTKYKPATIIPGNNLAMLDLMQRRFNTPFLFKAHGTTKNSSSVILTYNDYRELMHLSPEYPAFMQYIITNFNLVFYGFGLSDLDFDLFIHEIVAKFGSPLHKHVIIKTRNASELAKDILHKRRYGIYPLYINKYEDFCPLLDDALININKDLSVIVNQSICGNQEERQSAHKVLSRLSEPAKMVVSNNLKLQKPHYESSPHDNNLMFEYSEVCYTLGIIDAQLNKRFLIGIVNDGINHQPVGRALTMLRSVLDLSDIPLIKKWIRKYSKPLPGDTNNRILNYCEHYLVYVPSKYACI